MYNNLTGTKETFCNSCKTNLQSSYFNFHVTCIFIYEPKWVLIINEEDKVPQPDLYYHAKCVKTEILKPRSYMPMMHHLCKLNERRKDILLDLCMGSLFFFTENISNTGF